MAEAVEERIYELATKYGFKGKGEPGHKGTLIKLPGKIVRIRFLRDPWFTKKTYTFYEPLPWEVWKSYLASMTEAQLMACGAMAKASSALAGVDRWVRRKALSQVLRKPEGYPGRKPKKPKGEKISVEEAIRRARVALGMATV